MAVRRASVPTDVSLVPRAECLWRVVLCCVHVDDERRAFLEACYAVVPVPRISGVGAKYLAGLD